MDEVRAHELGDVLAYVDLLDHMRRARRGARR